MKGVYAILESKETRNDAKLLLGYELCRYEYLTQAASL